MRWSSHRFRACSFLPLPLHSPQEVSSHASWSSTRLLTPPLPPHRCHPVPLHLSQQPVNISRRPLGYSRLGPGIIPRTPQLLPTRCRQHNLSVHPIYWHRFLFPHNTCLHMTHIILILTHPINRSHCHCAPSMRPSNLPIDDFSCNKTSPLPPSAMALTVVRMVPSAPENRRLRPASHNQAVSPPIRPASALPQLLPIPLAAAAVPRIPLPVPSSLGSIRVVTSHR